MADDRIGNQIREALSEAPKALVPEPAIDEAG
jgi:hypothetical protein